MASDRRPIALVLLRRDLRLADHPALTYAVEHGFQPWLIHVDDPEGSGGWSDGAASRAWQRKSLAALAREIEALGGALILRQGSAAEALLVLCQQAPVSAVFWNRRYEPVHREQDKALKTLLRARGLEVRSFAGNLLMEPWLLATQQGDPYRVFSPYWRNLSGRLAEMSSPLPAPDQLPRPPIDLGPSIDAMFPAPKPRWDSGFWNLHCPGTHGAWRRLASFFERIRDYKALRDRPDLARTSGLSAHLAFGEITPRQIVHAIRQAGELAESGGAAGFERELGWREFSYHLLFHFPHSTDDDLTSAMGGFAWNAPQPELLTAWQRGRTGIPMVDAGMRELWATGTMHNRVRMLVASFLTKNLRYHWLHGARWFWDTLVDADLANNTQGWQWSAGTGADAAPYFRIFNPVSQGKRFDPEGAYVRRWIPELSAVGDKYIHEPWLAPTRIGSGYPTTPLVDLSASRQAALDAWQQGRELRSMLRP